MRTGDGAERDYDVCGREARDGGAADAERERQRECVTMTSGQRVCVVCVRSTPVALRSPTDIVGTYVPVDFDRLPFVCRRTK